MSQSNTIASGQSTLNNNEPQLASRNDHRDRSSPTAGLLDQYKDVAQSDPKNSGPTSIEQVATSRTSTTSPRSDDNRVQDVCGASTCAGIKRNAYPSSRVRLGSSHAMECVQCATIAKRMAAGVPMIDLRRLFAAMHHARKLGATESSTSLGRL